MIFDSSMDNHRTNRFEHVIQNAERQAVLFVLLVGESGDKDDGSIRSPLLVPQTPQHFVTIHSRHGDIQQNKINVGFLVNSLERGGPILCKKDTALSM